MSDAGVRVDRERAYWEGQRVRLRAMEPGDEGFFHALNREHDVDRSLEMVWPPSSLARQKAWVEQASSSTNRGDGDHKFMIEAIDSGELVGVIDTHHCDPRVGKFEYGLAVREAGRNRGYASEAILLVLRYYFFELRYQKADPGVFDFNDASRRLHEKLGFTLEGVRRRAGYSHGEYHDMLLYGMTVEEFTEQHPDYAYGSER